MNYPQHHLLQQGQHPATPSNALHQLDHATVGSSRVNVAPHLQQPLLQQQSSSQFNKIMMKQSNGNIPLLQQQQQQQQLNSAAGYASIRDSSVRTSVSKPQLTPSLALQQHQQTISFEQME